MPPVADDSGATAPAGGPFISWDDGAAEQMSQLVDDGLVYPVIAESPRHAVPDEMPAPDQWHFYALSRKAPIGQIGQVMAPLEPDIGQVEGNDNGA